MHAGVAELADAQDLKSCGTYCVFLFFYINCEEFFVYFLENSIVKKIPKIINIVFSRK